MNLSPLIMRGCYGDPACAEFNAWFLLIVFVGGAIFAILTVLGEKHMQSPKRTLCINCKKEQMHWGWKICNTCMNGPDRKRLVTKKNYR